MRKLSAEEEKDERAAANLVTWRRMSDCSSAIVAFGAVWAAAVPEASRQSTRDLTKKTLGHKLASNLP